MCLLCLSFAPTLLPTRYRPLTEQFLPAYLHPDDETIQTLATIKAHKRKRAKLYVGVTILTFVMGSAFSYLGITAKLWEFLPELLVAKLPGNYTTTFPDYVAVDDGTVNLDDEAPFSGSFDDDIYDDDPHR
jgi:hypothetical protein